MNKSETGSYPGFSIGVTFVGEWGGDDYSLSNHQNM